MARRMKALGFTLVELLVVITIIVVLMALLAPALEKAIYEAELVSCAGNLKLWGTMSHDFARDHQRRLPMAFVPVNNPSGTAAVLDRISDESDYESSGKWKTHGTPWETWLSYGMNDKTAVCPIWRGSGSAPSASYHYDDPAAPAPRRIGDQTGTPTDGLLQTQWGRQVWIGYQWIGGTNTLNGQHGSNTFAWNSRSPASKLTDAGSSNVLASDLLWMNTAWNTNPPNNFRAVAHPTASNPAQAQSMSITFGDTHVEIERESFFERPQVFGITGAPTPAQYSYRGGASYHWWGK